MFEKALEPEVFAESLHSLHDVSKASKTLKNMKSSDESTKTASAPQETHPKNGLDTEIRHYYNQGNHNTICSFGSCSTGTEFFVERKWALSLESFRKVLSIKPDFVPAFVNVVYLETRMCLW